MFSKEPSQILKLALIPKTNWDCVPTPSYFSSLFFAPSNAYHVHSFQAWSFFAFQDHKAHLGPGQSKVEGKRGKEKIKKRIRCKIGKTLLPLRFWLRNGSLHQGRAASKHLNWKCSLLLSHLCGVETTHSRWAEGVEHTDVLFGMQSTFKSYAKVLKTEISISDSDF